MKAPVQLNELRHYVEIENFQRDEDGPHGEKQGEWAVTAKMRAKVEKLNESEAEAARQVYALAQFRLTMRYTPHVYSNSRVCFDGMKMNVGSINNLEFRNKWLVLLCAEAD